MTKRNDKVRLTVDLPISEAFTLATLAKDQGCLVTEALRRAVATDHALQSQRKDGATVLLEDKKGNVTELVFNR